MWQRSKKFLSHRDRVWWWLDMLKVFLKWSKWFQKWVKINQKYNFRVSRWVLFAEELILGAFSWIFCYFESRSLVTRQNAAAVSIMECGHISKWFIIISVLNQISFDSAFAKQISSSSAHRYPLGHFQFYFWLHLALLGAHWR